MFIQKTAMFCTPVQRTGLLGWWLILYVYGLSASQFNIRYTKHQHKTRQDTNLKVGDL